MIKTGKMVLKLESMVSLESFFKWSDFDQVEPLYTKGLISGIKWKFMGVHFAVSHWGFNGKIPDVVLQYHECSGNKDWKKSVLLEMANKPSTNSEHINLFFVADMRTDFQIGDSEEEKKRREDAVKNLFYEVREELTLTFGGWLPLLPNSPLSFATHKVKECQSPFEEMTIPDTRTLSKRVTHRLLVG